MTKLAPDWIFITGDLLNVPEGLPHLFRFLEHLQAIAPVYMTLGNHDHYSGVPVAQYAELADRLDVYAGLQRRLGLPRLRQGPSGFRAATNGLGL